MIGTNRLISKKGPAKISLFSVFNKCAPLSLANLSKEANPRDGDVPFELQCVAVCCSVLQCVAVCCGQRSAKARLLSANKPYFEWIICFPVAFLGRNGMRSGTHKTLQYTITHCNRLQHDLLRQTGGTQLMYILQHAATYCNMLQHTAT